MIEKGLHITEDKILHYHPFSTEETGLIMYCNPFKVGLEDIKIIAICPRLPFDDERLFVVLIDNQGKVYPIPDIALNSAVMERLENYYGLQSIKEMEWDQLDYVHHYGFTGKVLYPANLYGQSLYRNTFESWDTFKEGFKRIIGISHYSSGIFTSEIENEIRR